MLEVLGRTNFLKLQPLTKKNSLLEELDEDDNISAPHLCTVTVHAIYMWITEKKKKTPFRIKCRLARSWGIPVVDDESSVKM